MNTDPALPPTVLPHADRRRRAHRAEGQTSGPPVRISGLQTGTRAHPRVEDVRLAAAAAGGDEEARRQVEQMLEGALVVLATELGDVGPALEGAADRCWARLFRDDGRPSGLLAYRGRGRLAAWLQSQLVREYMRGGAQ